MKRISISFVLVEMVTKTTLMGFFLFFFFSTYETEKKIQKYIGKDIGKWALTNKWMA